MVSVLQSEQVHNVCHPKDRPAHSHCVIAASPHLCEGWSLAQSGKLLEALMAQPGRVLSKAQLQDKLYDWDGGLESNALEVHVHRLRRKIHPDVIRTIRGVGYAMGRKRAATGPDTE